MISMRKATTSVAAVALFVFSAMPVYAAASEADVTAALTAAFSMGGTGEAKVNFGTPTVDGDDIVYSNVEVTPGSGEGKTTITTLTVSSPEIEGDTLKAALIVAEGMKSNSNGNDMSVESFEVDDAVVPTKAGATGAFSALSLSGIVANNAGSPPIKIATVSAEAAGYVDGIPTEGSLTFEGIDVAIDANDPNMAQLVALGYSKLVVDAYVGGKWDKATGNLAIDEISLNSDEAGSVSLTASLGGFTEDVIKQLQQPNPPPEVMGSVTLESASFTYSDASLTGRLLDMFAKQAGQPKEAFVEQITGALPLMLAALQNPGFQDKVSTAATTFLKDPKNFTISVAPDAPIGFMDLMMAAQMEPQSLPDKLKAEITANDPEDDGDEQPAQ